jgi:DNA-binding NarL/FixJ family response regulator
MTRVSMPLDRSRKPVHSSVALIPGRTPKGPMKRAPRVLVIEDEHLVALDACRILSDAGFEALPPVTSADQAEEAVHRSKPDLVLLDVALDGEDGLELGARLRARFNVKVVIVSAHSDRATVERAQPLDPHGFVVKPFHTAQLVATVTSALAAKEAPPEVSSWADVGVENYDLLTQRERHVLDRLLTGRRISGIAAEEGVSAHTVRNQVKSIMFKLDVHSQDELVALFTRRVER